MTHYKRIDFNINKLIKNSLIVLPILFSIIAILVIFYLRGITSYPFWGMTAGFSIFLQLLYSVSFFIDPKYFVRKSKKFLPMWFIFSALSIISEFILLIFNNKMIYFFLPLTIIAIIGSLIKLYHTKRKYASLAEVE